mgnify:CR=1 FL=1
MMRRDECEGIERRIIRRGRGWAGVEREAYARERLSLHASARAARAWLAAVHEDGCECPR